MPAIRAHGALLQKLKPQSFANTAGSSARL